MNLFNHALKLDVTQKYNEALIEYETAIEEGIIDIDLYINLSFLYWLSASQFTWADYYKIPMEIRNISVDKYKAILDEAKEKFSDNAEIYFLEKYFEHRLIFEPLTQNDVLNIISKHKLSSLIPYFFLYLFDEKKYKPERDKILEECQDLPTAKNLYIKSIIEG